MKVTETDEAIAFAIRNIRLARRGTNFITEDECGRIVRIAPQTVIDNAVEVAIRHIPVSRENGYYTAVVQLNGTENRYVSRDELQLYDKVRYELLKYCIINP